jgi:multidrug efflux pump subunit AcrB
LKSEVLPEYAVQALILAAATILTVAYLFIPSVSVAVLIAFSILSILVGVSGYLVPFGAAINPVFVIGVLMCVGFCVDFASHISYAFFTAQFEDPADKVADALGRLGWPIMQVSNSLIEERLFLPTDYRCESRTGHCLTLRAPTLDL